MEPSEIVALPYAERRIVVVADEVPATSTSWPSWVGPLVAGLAGGLVGMAAVAVVQAIRDFREAGENITPINWETAKQLRFPPGHPRRNVVYVGHPVDPGSYIPAADFHRFLFEHKVAEAQRLVRSLGAAEVRVMHVQGWDRSAAIRLGLNLPEAASGMRLDLGSSGDTKESAGHQVLMSMKLTPMGEPRMPEGLVWTPHEPLWKEVAHARLESGLKEFVIDVRSTDDFGVNSELKLLIQDSGLDAGGKFVEHQETVWRLEGTFS